MQDDQAGHYAALGVDPRASAAALRAAFRRAARRLHPDVPETGDAAAFIRLKAAYDVLGDPASRYAYDHAPPPALDDTAGDAAANDAEADFPGAAFAAGRDAPPSPSDALIAGWRRPPAAALALGAAFACCAALALVIGFSRLHPSPPNSFPVAPPAAPLAAPPVALHASSPPPTSSLPPPAPPLAIEGAGDFYIRPAGEPATVWRPRAPGDAALVPDGTLAAFSLIQVQRLVPEHGMLQIVQPGGQVGLVSADRVAPGGRQAAERARCIYEAGAPPVNNEFLDRRGDGPSRVLVENRRDQPAVVKFRTAEGADTAAVFVAPGARVTVSGLPAATYQPEVAYGELWSRACRRFMAGMRAQRFAAARQLGAPEAPGSEETRYVIPPDDGIDEPDAEFNRD